MQAFLMICIGLLLASCGGKEQPKPTVAAIESGEKTRMEWQKARKPVEIHLEGMEGTIPAWLQLGVYMDVITTTPEERQAFAGAMFTRKGDVYVPANRHAATSDTMATISVCHPFQKGLGTNETLRLAAPFDENLYGVEIIRTIGNTIKPTFRLQSSMSLLRIVCGSDDMRDRLDEITITGENIYTEGSYLPYTGRWLDKKANGSLQAGGTDCLLNNGGKHDLYLIPTGTAGSITLSVRINGRFHSLRTMLPPMAAGSLTHLSIRKDSEGVAINGSWVETERSLAYEHRMMPVDSVQTGHYLQRNGTIQAERDTLSIAVVVETDGKHGKAVALSDSQRLFVFSGNNLSSGRLFPTIDGERKEGVVNPTTGIGEDDRIIYKPGMPYPDDCALGYADGASLTQELINAQEKMQPGVPASCKQTMLQEVARHPGSYVPSLSELARLYYLLECDKASTLKGLTDPLQGEYLTCSESGKDTFYLMDFSNGIVIGGLSKRYGKAKLRLFYLF